MNELTKAIEQWSKDRGLDTSDPSKQLNKMIEEIGELAQGLNKQNREQIADGIGDVYVTLVILSQQLELDFKTCVEMAYNEIKDRKGKMVNGTFIKESDLVEKER